MPSTFPASFLSDSFLLTMTPHVPGDTLPDDSFTLAANAHDLATLIDAYWNRTGLALTLTLADDVISVSLPRLPMTRQERWFEWRKAMHALFPNYYGPANVRDMPTLS